MTDGSRQQAERFATWEHSEPPSHDEIRALGAAYLLLLVQLDAARKEAEEALENIESAADDCSTRYIGYNAGKDLAVIAAMAQRAREALAARQEP